VTLADCNRQLTPTAKKREQQEEQTEFAEMLEFISQTPKLGLVLQGLACLLYPLYRVIKKSLCTW
jgi:hypothetical protein